MPAAQVLGAAAQLARALGRCGGSAAMIDVLLPGLARELGFAHAALLVLEPERGVLVTVASHGFPRAGVGSEVRFGEGPIGTVAAHRVPVRIANLHNELRYGRAVRDEAARAGQAGAVRTTIFPPGVLDTQSILVVPLEHGGALVGVLAVESAEVGAFGGPAEAALTLIGAILAPSLGVASLRTQPTAGDGRSPPPSAAPEPCPPPPALWVHHPVDDAIFVDHVYLIRGVPGRILVRLLQGWLTEGRVAFSNRELRADASLQLPEWRDNLEARLVLLRRRLLEQPCGVRIEPTGRGRFALVVEGSLRLIEGPLPPTAAVPRE